MKRTVGILIRYILPLLLLVAAVGGAIALINSKEPPKPEEREAPGVRLADDPDAEDAAAPVLDADGAPIAYLVGPAALANALPLLSRACAAIAALDEAFEDLLEDASTDRHTGLPDREALLDELQSRMDEARPAREEFTLTLARLEPDAWDDIEDLHALADHAGFASITSWGVVALLGEPHPDDDTLDAAPFSAWAQVDFPWDGAEPVALLEHAESVLHALTQTDTV